MNTHVEQTLYSIEELHIWLNFIYLINNLGVDIKNLTIRCGDIVFCAEAITDMSNLKNSIKCAFTNYMSIAIQ